ncbi:hypothetical protein RUM43_004020 [Polyplax serrata]|uniref:Ig-like domain-containing protein n=1 Tax=Polyplax serrata TaxID=468196 RepID=A0AAN8XKJ5_POLSC
MSGSSLKLTCKLLLSTEPPTYVFWYHEKRMINYDRERGVEVVLGRYQSDLLIAKAQKTDAGNYTCAPSNAQSASIIVHILNSTLGDFQIMAGDVSLPRNKIKKDVREETNWKRTRQVFRRGRWQRQLHYTGRIRFLYFCDVTVTPRNSQAISTKAVWEAKLEEAPENKVETEERQKLT